MQTLEENVLKYHKLRAEIERLEELKKEIAEAIVEQMPEKKAVVAGFTVRKQDRLMIKIPLETARLMDAVTQKEVVDRDKIKQLFAQGEPIEGVSLVEQVLVSKVPNTPN